MAADLVGAFRAATIAHPRLVAADAELRRLLAADLDPGLILLFGPTGVGKSTLLERIQQTSLPEGDRPSPVVPVCLVRAHAPETAAFNWRDFYVDVLDQLAQPAIDETRPRPDYVDEWLPPARRGRATIADLSRAVAVAVRHRGTRALLVDEAPHLASAGSGRRIVQQLDVLKSLADSTGLTIVLAGTYELLAFRHLNAQLSRRCQEVHFARYAATDADDVTVWRSVVASLAARLPARSFDITACWQELYERTAGCVGILKPWLLQALLLAESRSQALSMAHLRATAVRTDAVRLMTQAALDGETRIASNDHEASRLRTLLGLTSRPPRKRRPGERRPKRDPVPVA